MATGRPGNEASLPLRAPTGYRRTASRIEVRRPGEEVRRPGEVVLAGAAGALAAGAVAHLAPALASWRALRCWAVPSLAGLGDAPHVAVTFDDGPDPASTPAFLDELDRLGWRATFFMLGSMVRRYPGLAADVVARGHEIGVHGDQHHSHLRRTPRWVADDVERARDSIAAITESGPVWFRPPYGAISSGSLLAARKLGLRTVLWTAWGRDWRAAATPASVIADLERGLGPGATVLLHDSDCTSAPQSWRAALGALPGLAGAVAARGMVVGPLGEHGVGRPPEARSSGYLPVAFFPPALGLAAAFLAVDLRALAARLSALAAGLPPSSASSF
jgi:peptidoglycan-N-acetylglucosamine deacetylase